MVVVLRHTWLPQRPLLTAYWMVFSEIILTGEKVLMWGVELADVDLNQKIGTLLATGHN